MAETPLFDFTEVSFKGKQYKFLKETPKRTGRRVANVRSRSVVSPLPDVELEDEDSLRSNSPAMQDSQEVSFSFDKEQIKHFAVVPSDLYRTPHVDALSPEEERRVFHILMQKPKTLEATQRRTLGETARADTCIKDVFQYFQNIKQFNAAPSPDRPLHLPKLHPRGGASVPLRKGRILRKI